MDTALSSDAFQQMVKKKHESAAKCSGTPSLADMEERDTKQSCEWVLYHDEVCGWLSRNDKSTLGIALTHGNRPILALSGNYVDMKRIKVLSVKRHGKDFLKRVKCV